MNNELIKKAYEYYGGAWPDDNMDTVMYSSYHGYSLAKSMDRVSPYKSSSGGMFLLSVWEVACTKANFDAYGDSLKQDWMPKVGQECEFICTARGNEADSMGVIKYISKHTCVIDRSKNGPCGEFVAHPDTIKFRPLKTEREKFIEKCASIKKPHMWTEDEFLGAIFDSGARFND